MKKIKFCSAMISIFAIMIVSLLTYDLQAKVGFKVACNIDDDCEGKLKCAPVSTWATNKICKKGVGGRCNYDTDCANGSACKHKKGGKWYCKKGCISEANCISDQVCRGYVPGYICTVNEAALGRCYYPGEAGKEGTKCVYDSNCNKGLKCSGLITFFCYDLTSGTCKKK